MGISKLVSGHTIPFHFRNRISARKCNLYIVLLLKQTSHESEPDSPHPIGGGGSLHMSQSYTTTPCYRPRSSSVPRFTYGSIPPRSESPFGTASSTCSSLRGGVESDAGIYHQRHRPAISPPETRAFLHEALDEVCSDFERTLERTSVKRRKSPYGTGSLSMDRNNNKLSLSISNGHGALKELKSHRLGNSTWDRHFDVAGEWASERSTKNSMPKRAHFINIMSYTEEKDIFGKYLHYLTNICDNLIKPYSLYYKQYFWKM